MQYLVLQLDALFLGSLSVAEWMFPLESLLASLEGVVVVEDTSLRMELELLRDVSLVSNLRLVVLEQV